MKKRILPIRLTEESILKAEDLVPFVREKEKETATRSDVIRLCFEYGLDAMHRASTLSRSGKDTFRP